jgi:peptide/nickel transport system permease protein
VARFLIRRLVGLAVVLFAISILVFTIFNVIPGGDPAVRLAGRRPTVENVQQIRKTWGFDKSLPVQYIDMMKKLFTGHDFISYQNQTAVLPTIERGIPRTFSVALGAGVIWLFFGILFGVISGVFQGRWVDHVLSVVALVGISTPVFWLGAVLLYLFTFKYHHFGLFSWVPAGGYVGIRHPLAWAQHLFLPWISLAAVEMGFYSRVVRSSLLDARSKDFVRTARAKGVPASRVLLHHVLRNSLLPVITLFGLDFGATVGGTVILVEPVFGIEGVGQYAQESVAQLDLPPLIALTLYGAFFVVIFNTLVDLIHPLLDPRVRLS